MDGGVWEEPLKKTRRALPIAQKLQVVDYYLELKAQKEDAAKKLQEPRPANATRAQLRSFFEKRRELRKKMKSNLEKECRAKFPDILGHCYAYRWADRAKVESWHELPEAIRARAVETTNDWRRKMGQPLKGQPQGGQIPWVIQKELDMLMIEVSSGMSDVTERKEIVTIENIVAGGIFSIVLSFFGTPKLT